ncbi:hypothetical protein AB835_14580 [Candidatus Endobugula sertula]|uniref:Uncharacterized protein n=1 Tax=Candidatus Endobugula sertula TaxID=62101 RepID=A0A1D2QLB9_9GAMM|nr:hypothetical protein AB835_14580 [Candidatus Endobugula sertula]
MSTKNAGNAEDIDSLKEEIAQLKSQLDSLNAKQSKKSSNPEGDFNDFSNEFSRSVADTNRDINNEVTRLIRSYSDAAAAFYSDIGNVANVATEEFNKRTESDGNDAVKNLNALPNHLYGAYLKALNESAKIPSKVLSTFKESYQKEQSAKA